MDSYDLGRFPPLWREWNGKYRDSMRDFWRSHPVGIGEFADRFAGSADLYGAAGRRPTASVNLITVHDGFTLRDLVSYNDKHNEANGEDNRDGTSDNNSWNCGAEGPTDDPEILALRARQSRAMLTTLMLSFGVPLLLGGDELGRTQGGNNNAYCQDNEITWFDWASADTDLLDFTKRLIALREAHPVFRRRRFLVGAEAAELQLVHPRGQRDDGRRLGGSQRAGHRASTSTDPMTPTGPKTAHWLLDDDFLVLVNAWWEPLDFVLPATRSRPRGVPRSTPTTPPPPPERARTAPATTSPSAPGPSWCCPIRVAADRAGWARRTAGTDAGCMGEVNVAVIAPILGRDLSFVTDVDPRVRVFDANFAAPGHRAGSGGAAAPGSDLLAEHPCSGRGAAGRLPGP